MAIDASFSSGFKITCNPSGKRHSLASKNKQVFHWEIRSGVIGLL